MFKLHTEESRLLRKFEEDLWGRLRLKKSISNVSLFLLNLSETKRNKSKPFVFSILEEKKLVKKKRKSEFGILLENRKKICLYYGGLRLRRYKHLIVLAKNQKLMSPVNHLVQSLELTLSFILYRANFVCTVAEGIKLILSGGVLVNKHVIKDPHKVVFVGDLIEIVPFYKAQLFASFLWRLENEQVYHLELSHLCINYSIMSIYVVKVVSLNTLVLPFKLDPSFFYSQFAIKF